ncbi:uncharacterized protein BO97DRAFT_446403 [Aspergillus homomorphus CBS 101889]|uniref:Uncharacterized protein n=1 Tax=Aspergillus homomorphus (strain CBS 101889) TaxID=1450537 RepID=A0A395HJN2_ASPHC|nr:hypothetical protein BO97DRAFT_446403 [Aspergillus homomorphus CBS 101889]RAL08121.1 hypothetical protein BO97DRAFT_446403 [Aspergillus homomorphus CBS 101889]
MADHRDQPSLPGASLSRALHLTGTILMLNLLLFVAFLRDIDPSSDITHRIGLCQAIRRKERRIVHLSALIMGLESADLSLPDDPEAAQQHHLRHSTVDAQVMKNLNSLSCPITPTELEVSAGSLHQKKNTPQPSKASVLSTRISNRAVSKRTRDSTVTKGGSGGGGGAAAATAADSTLVYPPRVSDSIYSATLRRSVSLGSEHRQSTVLPHIRYSGFMTERLRFSVLSQPWSVASVAATDNEAAQQRGEPVVVEEIGDDRLQPACSVDTFPGQFPISDGVELSWLATASQRPGAGLAQDAENGSSDAAGAIGQTSARPYTEA